MKSYIKKNKARFIEELFELLRVPSISADSKYIKQTKEAALLVKERLVDAGVDFAELCETNGHPIVFGEKIICRSLPTILVYGHYDVQPPDPLNLWSSPPFDPVIKKTSIHPDGAIFARGACDDKGQLYMHIKAFEAMIKTNSLPCNVKFMIEGEEEVGSNNLAPFVKNNKEKLLCDVILISDTGILANNVPSITVGLRGLSYLEVDVVGPNRDLHSGLYGGCVANPINVLCDLIALLKDKNNKIKIPGFYDKVEILGEQEQLALKKIPFSLSNYKESLDLSDIEGERGFSTIERGSVRPTLDVNGIWGGYAGEGAKTVIPSKASAKISMRLVPNQSSQEISVLFEKHFRSIAPKSVLVSVRHHHGGEPYVCPINTPEYQAAHLAMKDSFGVAPIPIRGGGSIPIVALFEKELKTKSILLGFGLDSDAIHSPNEHFGLFNFFKGIETIPLFYKNYVQLKS